MVGSESGEWRSALSERIRRKLAVRGWTQAQLAKASGYDERTIRNVLNGQSARYQTVVEICKALELEPEDKRITTEQVAAEQFGAYARSSFALYVGDYFGYRRVFSKSRRILRTFYSIAWSAERHCLVFSEFQDAVSVQSAETEPDPSHGGNVYVSAHTGLIHLVTVFQGAVRLVTLTKMKNQTLRGVVLTQSERSYFFQPSVSALLLKKSDGGRDQRLLESKIGTLSANDGDFESINAELREIEAEVIFFAQPQDA